MLYSAYYVCNHYSFEKLIKRKEREGYYKRSPNLKKIDYQYYNYQKKTFKKFIELILMFAKNFPEKEIFVRPHPTEEPIYWKNLLKGHKNIHIKAQDDLTKYINNSECVIQNGCTSAIAVSYTHLRAHETDSYLVCRLLLEKSVQGDCVSGGRGWI